MLDGFIKTAVVTPRIKVADCKYNAGEISGGWRRPKPWAQRLLCFPNCVSLVTPVRTCFGRTCCLTRQSMRCIR